MLQHNTSRKYCMFVMPEWATCYWTINLGKGYTFIFWVTHIHSIKTRSSREVRACDGQCLYNSHQSCVQSQHPPTQWNLRSSRWRNFEYITSSWKPGQNSIPEHKQKRKEKKRIEKRKEKKRREKKRKERKEKKRQEKKRKKRKEKKRKAEKRKEKKNWKERAEKRNSPIVVTQKAQKYFLAVKEKSVYW